VSERRDGPARGKDRGRPQRANIGREIAKRKRAEREERLELQRRAVRFRLVVAVVVLVAVIGGGLALYRSQAFAVRVVAPARVPGDTTLLRLPSAEIAQRLEKEPWIAEAKVRRVFPDTVQIDVVERRPVAAVDARQELWLVDPITQFRGSNEGIPR
jgi:cell division protein FtsQ